MAAKHFYRQGFLLLLFNFMSTADVEKRFSDFKRCADEECSMLLCRGKAVKDFTGPDCRFLSFKKSETIYVYYKLSGRRADMWAGSVGSSFGYFPKDLLAVNHLYTDRELEVQAEETDFVCFDTGYDKFDNYNIDSLLGLSVEKNDGEDNETSDKIQGAEGTQKETQPTEEEASTSEKPTEHHDTSEDLDKVDDKMGESHTAATPDATEGATEEEVEQKHMLESVLDTMSEMNDTKDTPTESVPNEDVVSENESVSVSEGVQIPEAKTTLGTTFDAVITEEEITQKVTPYEDDDSEDLEHPPKDVIDVEEETPLLSFSEETVNTLASDSLKKMESKPTTQDDIPKTSEEKTMWTSLGDAVFSVVTGGEMTGQDLSIEEDDEEDEEEEDQEEDSPAKIPQSFEEVEREPLQKEFQEEFKNIQPVVQDPSHPNSVQSDIKIPDRHSDKLLFDHDDENDGEEIGREEALDETLKLTDEQIPHQTKVSGVSVDPVPQDDILGSPESDKSDVKTTQEPTEDIEEVTSMNSEVEGDISHVQYSGVATEQDLDNALDENKKMTDQELAIIENKTDQDLLTEESESDPSEPKQGENIADDSLPNQTHKHSMTYSESNNSQAELPVEEPEIYEEPHRGKRENEEDAEMEEERELLEDENALSLSQSNTSPESSLPTVSTPEPEYSDDVMRLSLLRDHFAEEKMEQVQKFLGLKNLYKLEAMLSELDTELQTTRLTHAGTTQNIEDVLEGIYEASENVLLDEIEKMLDSRDTKHKYAEQMDTSNLDEETEILDDFQDLAFSLRQKYSAASDSTPLVTEKPSEFEQDEHGLKVKEDTPPIVEDKYDSIPETKGDDNLTETVHEERPAEIEDVHIVLDEVPAVLEVNVEEDGGHFNKNKDNQPGFSPSHEMQATLEHPLDMGLGVEVENSPSGSMDSMEPVSEMHEEEVGLFSTGIVYTGGILSVIKNKTAEWTVLCVLKVFSAPVA